MREVVVALGGHALNMAPKIETSIEFLEAGGESVLVTDPEGLTEALEGRAGTRITR